MGLHRCKYCLKKQYKTGASSSSRQLRWQDEDEKVSMSRRTGIDERPVADLPAASFPLPIPFQKGHGVQRREMDVPQDVRLPAYRGGRVGAILAKEIAVVLTGSTGTLPAVKLGREDRWVFVECLTAWPVRW
jgi:hypothetical protein